MRQISFRYFLLLSFLSIKPLFSEDLIEKSKAFSLWLESHKDEMIKCTPVKSNENYTLCDNTTISKNLLVKLYKMTPDELVTFKITLKVFCKPQEISGSFKKYCTPNDQNNAQKNARLQGQYHPVTNTIDIQSDAYQGSLIHEYIHYLQYKNENLIDEKRYKFERANLQQSLVKLMDEKTLEVKESAKEKNQKKVKELVAIVVQASGQLMNYSPWQDLIDEKNIFLLYKKFGHEFGVKDEDLALASLNMGFICKRFKLPEAQCL